MSVQRKIETRLRNQCCCVKSINIIYYDYVLRMSVCSHIHKQENLKKEIKQLSVALVVRHAMRMRRIIICGLLGYTTFFHIIS